MPDEIIKQDPGVWIKNEDGIFICSRCNNGYRNQPTCMGVPLFAYCPVCGVKMTHQKDSDNT